MDIVSFKILNPEITELVGEAIAIAGGYDLTAFFKSIVLKYDPENFKSASSIARGTFTKLDDAIGALKSDKGSKFFIFEIDNLGDYKYDKEKEIKFPTLSEEFTVLEGESAALTRREQKTIAFYIDETNHRSCIVVEKRITRVDINSIMVLIAKLLPWYYTPEERVANRDFFRSIYITDWANRASAEEALLKFCNDIYEASSIEAERKHLIFANMAKMPRENILNAIKRIYDDIRSESERLNANKEDLIRRLDEVVNKLEEVDIRYKAAKDRKEEMEKSLEKLDGSVFEKFFDLHKNDIVIDKVINDRIFLTLFAVLTGYEEEDVKRAIANPDCKLSKHKFTKTFNEIFVNHRGLIRTVAKIALIQNMRNLNYNEDTRYDYETGYKDYPHMLISPHWLASCQGANGSEYSKCLRNGEWDMALEQALWACSNWNVDDTTITERVLEFYSYNDNVNYKNIWIHPDLSPLYEVDDTCILVSLKELHQMFLDKEKAEKEAARKAAEEAKRTAEIAEKIRKEAEKIAAEKGISVDEAIDEATAIVEKRIAAAKKAAETKAAKAAQEA